MFMLKAQAALYEISWDGPQDTKAGRWWMVWCSTLERLYGKSQDSPPPMVVIG